MEDKENIVRALADLGWETRSDPDRTEIVGSYGKYHLLVSFKNATPTSVIISYVGRGGQLLSRKWPGTARLPRPEQAVRTLSQNK